MAKSKGRRLAEFLRRLNSSGRVEDASDIFDTSASLTTSSALSSGTISNADDDDTKLATNAAVIDHVDSKLTALGLQDLSNTTFTGLTSGHVLSYNGTNWVNSNDFIGLTDLSVGTPNSASGSGAISYSSSTGEFKYTPPDLSSYLTSVPAQSFASLTGKPTTISGYGITDAYTNSSVDSHLNQSNPTSGYVLSWNGSDYAWVAQSGNVTDITGHAAHLIRTDNRTISPSEYTAGDMNFGFTSWNNNNTSPYADFIHLRSYTDSSGGSDNLLMFKKSGVGMRLWQQTYGSSTAYSSPANVLLYTSSTTVPQGVTASNVTTRTDLNMRNYRYRATTHTPTRGEYGYHLYHNWTDNLELTLTDSSWQRGDVVEIASTRSDRNVTINATRIYMPNGSYDTQVTYNNQAGCFKIIKYSDTQGYWMVAMDG